MESLAKLTLDSPLPTGKRVRKHSSSDSEGGLPEPKRVARHLFPLPGGSSRRLFATEEDDTHHGILDMFLCTENDVDSDEGEEVCQGVTGDGDSIMSTRVSSFFKGAHILKDEISDSEMVILNSEGSDQELALPRQRADHDDLQDTLIGDLSSSDSSSDDEPSWMSPSPEAIAGWERILESCNKFLREESQLSLDTFLDMVYAFTPTKFDFLKIKIKPLKWVIGLICGCPTESDGLGAFHEACVGSQDTIRIVLKRVICPGRRRFCKDTLLHYDHVRRMLLEDEIDCSRIRWIPDWKAQVSTHTIDRITREAWAGVEHYNKETALHLATLFIGDRADWKFWGDPDRYFEDDHAEVDKHVSPFKGLPECVEE
ncbi:uncharacterized protein NECHADRAFT_88685 [Fusarium vanettenii 77-13-4]|uniref:Uncharacterized protein n=1 Tax=Fusarium vanettenii (strain ATCC MYA-4622 / CBS 123669 / FGSC 9596 / NRRL 45880 / 77-13-4) TaxID=660122 RepID=C7ZLI3_FUSV7|nr:uncharacterized protein NECHADRAFT_88685 [Fusarium vanettenii 77-13-4]EEU35122.1 predicted protein [Fusarium vanettenii 77-13-4]